jgi:hypothetical protein
MGHTVLLSREVPMKTLKVAVAIAFAALACLPTAALAHTGSAAVSCSEATLRWVNFGAGSNTISYRIDVDSTTALQGTFVLNESRGTAGHLTIPLTLYGVHRVQVFSWWGPSGTVNGESRPASAPALADETVTCAAAPPAPVPPAPAPPPPTTQMVPAPAATSVVVVARKRANSSSTYRLMVQRSCATRGARVTVKAAAMRQVRLSVRGQRARTLTARPGTRSVSGLVALRPRGAAAQRVTARITFRNGSRPRTLVAVVRRCSRASIVPKLAG